MTTYFREHDRRVIMREELMKEVTKEVTQKAYEKEVAMILSMFNNGLSNELVQAVTKMPIEDIVKLRAENAE